MKFLQVSTIEDARAKLLEVAAKWLPVQHIWPIATASGKILAKDIYASEDVPHFRRSTVDGYAVMSKDTAAAGESLPSFLKVVGSIEMGFSADFAISSGEIAEVPTGGIKVRRFLSGCSELSFQRIKDINTNRIVNGAVLWFIWRR